MKTKRPKIDEALNEPIQDYANANHDGNFTKAVNDLLESALEDLGWFRPTSIEIRQAQKLKNLQATELMERSAIREIKDWG